MAARRVKRKRGGPGGGRAVDATLTTAPAHELRRRAAEGSTSAMAELMRRRASDKALVAAA
jgi:GH24 family phage-related lysozyme (muramidase)